MRWRPLIGLLACLCCVLVTSPAWAGMGAVTLDEVPRYLALSNLAKLRIDAISFFAFSLLGIAWAIQRVWNSFAKEFPSLPRISYLRSLGAMGLWGLLFMLVLTMISGARELMTPGAWKKNGFTYQLNDGPSTTTPPVADAAADN